MRARRRFRKSGKAWTRSRHVACTETVRWFRFLRRTVGLVFFVARDSPGNGEFCQYVQDRRNSVQVQQSTLCLCENEGWPGRVTQREGERELKRDGGTVFG